MTEHDELIASIHKALKWCERQGIEIPIDIQLKAYRFGALKAEDDLAGVNAKYHDAITAALTDYMEGGNIVGDRNSFKRAATAAFLDSFQLGWTDAGGGLPLEEEDLTWLNARLETEFGYIAELFEQAKALRGEEDFDFAWVSERADAYTNTLREIYNSGSMRAMDGNIMVSFLGDDGAESCSDCSRLKGQRHRLKWFIARDVVPPHGRGLECHPGRKCQHYLQDDKGNIVTV